jgi:transposase
MPRPSTPDSPPRNGKNGNWRTPTRSRVLGLLDRGFTQVKISEELGVPPSTISYWASTRQSRRTKTRSGRPPKLNKHDVRRLIGILRTNWDHRKLCWRKLGKQAGLDVSGKTIKRALNAAGYTRCKACKKPFISKRCQGHRKEYAAERIYKPVEYWQQHMYADECSFDTSKRGSTWVTRQSHERYHEDCMQHSFHSGRTSIHVWGAISYNWKSPLVIFDPPKGRGVNSIDYLTEVLDPIVGPAFCGCFGYEGFKKGGQYVEDQAGIHGTKGALVEEKKVMGIQLHKRPASSPDLNPIENVWRTMKQRIKARDKFPATAAEMRTAVQEEWDRLRPEDWNQFIDSMPERINELRRRKGLQTPY